MTVLYPNPCNNNRLDMTTAVALEVKPQTNLPCSDSFTILGLWVLGLAVSNIDESQLQTYESKTLFLMTSLQYYCIPGLAEIKTYAQKMQDAQVTKSLTMLGFAQALKVLEFRGLS